MILDKLENSSSYSHLNERINRALDFLRETDFSVSEKGKIAIEGDKIFALVNEYVTQENENSILEAHRKYIDVQYVYSGEERIDFESLGDQVVYKSYDEDEDYWLCKTLGSSTLILSEGMFTIFNPQDLHLPGLNINGKSSSVKKVVVKVLID